MQIATGESIVKKIAIGKIQIYKRNNYIINENDIIDVDAELERLEYALKEAVKEQNDISEKILCGSGKENADIFKAHAMILEDQLLCEEIRKIIKHRKKPAEYAVEIVFNNYAEMFSQMDDPYMQARGADIYDVKKAVQDVLLGTDKTYFKVENPVIFASEDLTPSETVKLNNSMILGIIIRDGSINSHMAIIARSLNIPTIIQCKELDDSWDGRTVIIDGYSSCVYVDPTDDVMGNLLKK